ncbi:MAG: SDR family oxidoreductase [Solirubrobacteraceae bacterium]
MSDPRRTAIVTGAGSGIGAAVTVELLRAGWQVGLAGRREHVLAKTAAAAAGAAGERRSVTVGDDALVIPTDVTDPDAVRALFGAAIDAWGRLDLLFNNAGVFGRPAPLDEYELDEWRAVVDTNLTGCFLCAREAFRAMKTQRPQGGRIINNGSISAHVPRRNAVAYTATKHAITGLTRAISLDGRAFEIACGQIDIGNASTELSAQLGSGTLQADGTIAPEPMMDVRHAAAAVVQMAELPLDANVQFMTIMATAMPYIGRG